MPYEANLIRERLTDAGLDQVQVYVKGIQYCPGVQTAEWIALIEISITVPNTADSERFGEIINIIQASTSDWPEKPIRLAIYDADRPLLTELIFTNQDVQVLQAAGYEGAALYEALLQSSPD